MNDNLINRAKRVAEAFQSWLHKAGSGMVESKERTISEGYFTRHDVDYSIQCFGRSVTEDKLLSWIKEQLYELPVVIPQKILCLHAGNLPLVGLQDVLACLMLGHEYHGKISRKDPYLIPSFLEYWKAQYSNDHIVSSTNLDVYQKLEADAVLFSGSKVSVPKVREVLQHGEMVSENTSYLIRTAHFSIAYLDNDDPAYLKVLAEAIARYDGKGCRSVAIVVSAVSLCSIQCQLTDCFEAFWTENPTKIKRNPILKYRMAYNKAIERSQVMLDKFLIEESEPDLEDNVIHWLQGGPELVPEIVGRFSEEVQNIYVTGSHVAIPGLSNSLGKIDLLSRAQCPQISWKPDGIDILGWLARPYG